jgi:hypothetical protein
MIIYPSLSNFQHGEQCLHAPGTFCSLCTRIESLLLWCLCIFHTRNLHKSLRPTLENICRLHSRYMFRQHEEAIKESAERSALFSLIQTQSHDTKCALGGDFRGKLLLASPRGARTEIRRGAHGPRRCAVHTRLRPSGLRHVLDSASASVPRLRQPKNVSIHQALLCRNDGFAHNM